MRRPRAATVAPARTTRLAGVAAAALAIGLLAGACDTSPVAASVNGVEIKQTALDEQIRLEAANTAYVTAFDRQAGAGGTGATIYGDAPGAFSARWVDTVLSTMISAEAVHQTLTAEGRQPSAAQLAAARSVDETVLGPLWLTFPEAFRDTQVEQDAEHALIEPTPSGSVMSDLRTAYQQSLRYFFSEVCVRTIAVAVTTDGTVDQSASYARALDISDQFNLTASDPALAAVEGVPQGGTVTCYDGAGLENQGPAMFAQVLGLAPGHAAAPQRTSFGYRVVEVDSRLTQPFDAAVQAALALGITEVQGSADPAYEAVVAKAHVTVDPQYGSWDPGQLEVVPSSPLGANSTSAAAQPGAGTGAADGSGGAAGGGTTPAPPGS